MGSQGPALWKVWSLYFGVPIVALILGGVIWYASTH